MCMFFDFVICGIVVLLEGLMENVWFGISVGKISVIGVGDVLEVVMVYDCGDNLILLGIIDGQIYVCSYGGFFGICLIMCFVIVGGVIIIVDMFYDNFVLLNNFECLVEKVVVIVVYVYVYVVFYVMILLGQLMDVVESFIEGGVVVFKILIFESSLICFFCILFDFILDIFLVLVDIVIFLGVYNEDQEIVCVYIVVVKVSGVNGIEVYFVSCLFVVELVVIV